ncbi:hypothetical protein HAV15_002021 [Penicillium sp. str. |nr:hypothetical protein HAV15_002021 [Penicillium sp. str. \
MAHISTVTKGPSIRWSPEEEKNLPTWVSLNEHLTWEEIREEYVRQFKIPRSVRTLRGKLNQIRRAIAGNIPSQKGQLSFTI